MKSIYLDYAAATPVAPEVVDAMQPYLADMFYNPSAQYLAAKAVSRDVEAARARVAHWLGARPSEVIFTAGGTEANNLAIHGVMHQFPHANIVVSAVEHEAVLAPASQYNHRLAPVTADGIVDLDALEKLIDDQTVLVSIMYANNEIGTVEPLQKIGELIAGIRTKRQAQKNALPLYFHTDACQAGAYLDLHVTRLGVDMMTINSGKIYGPKQTGALYVRAGITLAPQILGGGQEFGIRSGTENVAQVVGFATALDLVQNRRADEVKRLSTLQKSLITGLQKALPTAQVNGSLKQRLPNNVHITIPGTDNERLMMQLDEYGIQCAVGSACSASNDEPSHVLAAISLSDEDARASLRFSMGIHTTTKEIDVLIDSLVKAVRRNS